MGMCETGASKGGGSGLGAKTCCCPIAAAILLRFSPGRSSCLWDNKCELPCATCSTGTHISLAFGGDLSVADDVAILTTRVTAAQNYIFI